MIPKIKIDKMSFEDSCFVRGNEKWKAKTLYRYAKKQNIQLFEYPLAAFDLSISDAFIIDNISDFIFQAKRVNQCDYNIPIILDDYGQVADGYHRICKAILHGKTTIKAIRLNNMPEPDWVLGE